MPHSVYASKSEAIHSSENVESSDVDILEDKADEPLESHDGETSLDGPPPSCTLPPDDSARSVDETEAVASLSQKIEALARNFESDRKWIYMGDFLPPTIITNLAGWQAAGVVLEIVEDGSVIPKYGEEPCRSTDNAGNARRPYTISIERRFNCHYVALVDGQRVDLGGDGNCLFYSIWYALARTVPEETLRVLYQGTPPANKEDAAKYFRTEGARLIRQDGERYVGFLEDDKQSVDVLDIPLGRCANEVSSAQSPPFPLTDIAGASLVLAGEIPITPNLPYANKGGEHEVPHATTDSRDAGEEHLNDDEASELSAWCRANGDSIDGFDISPDFGEDDDEWFDALDTPLEHCAREVSSAPSPPFSLTDIAGASLVLASEIPSTPNLPHANKGEEYEVSHAETDSRDAGEEYLDDDEASKLEARLHANGNSIDRSDISPNLIDEFSAPSDAGISRAEVRTAKPSIIAKAVAEILGNAAKHTVTATVYASALNTAQHAFQLPNYVAAALELLPVLKSIYKGEYLSIIFAVLKKIPVYLLNPDSALMTLVRDSLAAVRECCPLLIDSLETATQPGEAGVWAAAILVAAASGYLIYTETGSAVPDGSLARSIKQWGSRAMTAVDLFFTLKRSASANNLRGNGALSEDHGAAEQISEAMDPFIDINSESMEPSETAILNWLTQAQTQEDFLEQVALIWHKYAGFLSAGSNGDRTLQDALSNDEASRFESDDSSNRTTSTSDSATDAHSLDEMSSRTHQDSFSASAQKESVASPSTHIEATPLLTGGGSLIVLVYADLSKARCALAAIGITMTWAIFEFIRDYWRQAVSPDPTPVACKGCNASVFKTQSQRNETELKLSDLWSMIVLSEEERFDFGTTAWIFDETINEGERGRMKRDVRAADSPSSDRYPARVRLSSFINATIFFEELGRVNKSFVNETTSEIVLGSDLDFLKNNKSRLLSVKSGANIFFQAVRNILVEERVMKSQEISSNSKLFLILKNPPKEIRVSLKKSLKKISSHSYFEIPVLKAMSGELAALRQVIEALCVFEVLKAKFAGDMKLFPYLEPIFGKYPTKPPIPDLRPFFASISYGYFDDVDDPAYKAYLMGREAFETYVLPRYPDGNTTLAEKIEEILDHDGGVRIGLSAAHDYLDNRRIQLEAEIYVHGNDGRSGGANLQKEYLTAILAKYSLVLSYVHSVAFMEYLFKVDKSTGRPGMVDDHNPASHSENPAVLLWKAQADSARLFLKRNPQNKYKDKTGVSPGELLKIYNEILENRSDSNINELLYGAAAAYLINTGLPPDELDWAARSIYSTMILMSDILLSNPVASAILSDDVREAADYLNNLQNNSLIGDELFFRQFSIIKDNAYVEKIAKAFATRLLLAANPDYYFLYSNLPLEITAYEMYGNKEPGKIELEDILATPKTRMKIRQNQPPANMEKFEGNLVCIKIKSRWEEGMFLVSNLLDDLVVKYVRADKLDSDTLRYFFNKENSILEDQSSKLIEMPHHPGYFLPFGSDVAIAGQGLCNGLLESLFHPDHEVLQVNQKKTCAAYLVYDSEKSNVLNGKKPKLQRGKKTEPLNGEGSVAVVQYLAAESARRNLSQTKNILYERAVWNRAASFMPYFDAFYFSKRDPDYVYDRISLITDMFDSVGLGTLFFRSFRTIGGRFTWVIMSHMKKTAMLNISQVSNAKALLALRGIVFSHLPLMILPFKLHGRWTAGGGWRMFFKSLDLKLSRPVLSFSSSNNIDWFGTFGNFLFFNAAEGIYASLVGKFEVSDIGRNQPLETLKHIALKEGMPPQISSDLQGDIHGLREFYQLFSEELKQAAIVKYQLCDGDGKYASPKNVTYLSMKNGEIFILDASKKGNAMLSRIDDWRVALMEKSANRPIKANLFANQKEADGADLSTQSELPTIMAGLLASPGKVFHSNGNDYYKPHGNETILWVANQFLGDASMAVLFRDFLNTRFSLDSLIQKDELIRLPYVECSQHNRFVIFSQITLPDGLKCGKVFIGEKLGSTLADHDAMVLNNRAHVNGDTRLYIVKADDTFESISEKFFGDKRWAYEIGKWLPNWKKFGSHFNFREGMIIQVPYAYQIRQASVSNEQIDASNHGLGGQGLNDLKKIWMEFFDGSERSRVIKYEISNGSGNAVDTGYAYKITASDGAEYFSDISMRKEGDWAVTLGKWKKYVEARAGKNRINAAEFDNLEAAQEGDLSDHAVSAVFWTGLLVEPGSTFDMAGKRYFKSSNSDTLSSAALKCFGYESMAIMFYFPEGNRGGILGKNARQGIGRGVVLEVPYIDYGKHKYFERERGGGLIFSEYRISRGFDYSGWIVESEHGTRKFFDAIRRGRSAGNATVGQIFFDNDILYYKTKSGDTFESISLDFYGDKAWHDKISGWKVNKIQSASGATVRSSRELIAEGTRIRLPYVYVGVQDRRKNRQVESADSPSAIRFGFARPDGSIVGADCVFVVQTNRGTKYVIDPRAPLAGNPVFLREEWLLKTGARSDGLRMRWRESSNIEDARKINLSMVVPTIEEMQSITPSGNIFYLSGLRFIKLDGLVSLGQVSKIAYGYEFLWKFLINSPLNDLLLARGFSMNDILSGGTVVSLPYIDLFQRANMRFRDVLLSSVSLRKDFVYRGGLKMKGEVPKEPPSEITEVDALRDSDGWIPVGTIFNRNGVRFIKAGNMILESIVTLVYGIQDYQDEFPQWVDQLRTWGMNSQILRNTRWPQPDDEVEIPYAYLMGR